MRPRTTSGPWPVTSSATRCGPGWSRSRTPGDCPISGGGRNSPEACAWSGIPPARCRFPGKVLLTCHNRYVSLDFLAGSRRARKRNRTLKSSPGSTSRFGCGRPDLDFLYRFLRRPLAYPIRSPKSTVLSTRIYRCDQAAFDRMAHTRCGWAAHCCSAGLRFPARWCIAPLHAESLGKPASACATNGTSLSVNPCANLQAIAIGRGLSYHRLWSSSLS